MTRKRKRPQRATDGGSRVALSALLRPGGAHGRRKATRDVEKRRAIREAS
jgi:hypothetical protein